MQETYRDVSPSDINDGFPKRELAQRTKVVRANNPLISGLSQDGNNFQRFTEMANDLIVGRDGIPIGLPRVVKEKESRDQQKFTVIILPHAGQWDERITESLRNLLRSLYQAKILQEGPSQSRRGVPRSVFMTTEVVNYKDTDADQIVGFILKDASGKKSKYRELEIRRSPYRGGSSEAEMVYETVMASLILAGKIDLSSEEALKETFPFRRKLFLHIYHELLEEMMPFVKRDDIHGLDEQIADINTNLYGPLTRGVGKPMNTLLVGAPGVGKTLVGNYFASRSDVLTVPLPVDYLENFERYVAPLLSRVKSAFGIPVVILVEDVEGLLEAAISIDASGGMSQIINPEKRAKALSLLERMQDTHGMYLLCTLNHPDVEAAFLRRLNTIYFPLPSDNQRRVVLEKIIDPGRLPNGDHQAVVEKFLGLTKNFNYSVLMLITDYVANIEQVQESNGHHLEGQGYEDALMVGCNKAKSRLSKASIVRFDKAARKMVGLDEADAAAADK